MDFLSNINWAQPNWDLFIILFFVVAAFLYGLSLGRDRVIVILVSIYMGLAIVNTAPYLNDFSAEVSFNNASIFKVTIFLGIFIALFFLLSRSALLHTIAASDSPGRWWQSILFSFFHVGLMISIVMAYLPKDIVNNVSAGLRNLFISDPAKFFWLVAPIVVMVLIRKGKKSIEG
ncbi:MAG: hypothetical protein NT116_02950 [Candidatus Parcubacteria bacterium]|nr:hypothetical protein [Candidatus Parcubacteria bacterium]